MDESGIFIIFASTLIVIVVAIVVKLALGLYVKHKGQQLKSDARPDSGRRAM